MRMCVCIPICSSVYLYPVCLSFCPSERLCVSGCLQTRTPIRLRSYVQSCDPAFLTCGILTCFELVSNNSQVSVIRPEVTLSCLTLSRMTVCKAAYLSCLTTSLCTCLSVFLHPYVCMHTYLFVRILVSRLSVFLPIRTPLCVWLSANPNTYQTTELCPEL